MDVKGAYLNGILEDKVYMRQLEGFIKTGKEDLVCKLKKGIYGLKQLGRVWHQTLKQEMYKIGFILGEVDSTIFLEFVNNGSIQLVGWYIEDRLLATNLSETMDSMVTAIKGSFEIQDLGEPVQLLGIANKRNRDLVLQPML